MVLRRRVVIEGLNLERLVKSAADAGMVLQDMQRTGNRQLAATVDIKQLSALEEVASRGGWRLTVGRYTGAAAKLYHMKSRWLLLAAAVLLLLACWAGTQVMWHVEVCDAGAYEADIVLALKELGIEPPMLRHHVDPAAIRDALEWRYPRIAWFECGWRGMTLVIRAVEGTAPGVSDSNSGACDVVAVRDGVVKSIITRAGTPVVKPGDVVRKGQVLIRGEERTSGGEVRPVAARGSVMARVWVQAAVETSLYEKETTYTGRTHTTQAVISPWFSLWQTEHSGFAQEDVAVRVKSLGGFFLPLWIRTETNYEADVRSVKRDFQSVLSENERAALQKLSEISGGKQSLVDNWLNWSIIEDEILLSVATGEMLVDIAQQERSSGMAATE